MKRPIRYLLTAASLTICAVMLFVARALGQAGETVITVSAAQGFEAEGPVAARVRAATVLVINEHAQRDVLDRKPQRLTMRSVGVPGMPARIELGQFDLLTADARIVAAGGENTSELHGKKNALFYRELTTGPALVSTIMLSERGVNGVIQTGSGIHTIETLPTEEGTPLTVLRAGAGDFSETSCGVGFRAMNSSATDSSSLARLTRL